MRKYIRACVLYLLMVVIFLQLIYTPKVFAKESEKSVTILFTHDMHDNMLPFKTEKNGKVVNLGGYAKLATAILREKDSDRQALLLDAGDFSMGTPFQTIFQSDSPELRIMGKLGYDAVTLGNHEFDYRAEGLANCLNTAKDSGDQLPMLVQSNMIFPTDNKGKLTASLYKLKKATENYGIRDYIILERNGIKIGIFVLMGADSVSKAPMSEVTFSNEIKRAKQVVKLLQEKEKAELIICLSHSGTSSDKEKSEDELLAKKVPQINVIISGHTHTELPKAITVGNTIIGSCGSYGKNLGVIKLTKQSHRNFKLVRYELEEISDTIPDDNMIKDTITGFKKSVQKKYFDKFNLKYDEVVAYSPFDFKSIEEMFAKHEESTLGNLISDAYVYAVKKAEGESYDQNPVAVSVVPCGPIRGSIFMGNITAADAFCISSLGIGPDKIAGYPLISVYLSGKELKAMCEVDASIAPIMGDAQLYLSGLSFTFNPNRLIFNKVVKSNLIHPDGSRSEIEDTKLYRVIAGLYSAQMLSVVGKKSFGLLSVVPKTKEGIPIKDYEAQIIYKTENGKKSEVKEWSAVVEYLKSFDKVDQIPQIPAYYKVTHERKIIENNRNVIVLLRKPNRIAITVEIIVLVIFILILILIIKMIRRNKVKKIKI